MAPTNILPKFSVFMVAEAVSEAADNIVTSVLSVVTEGVGVVLLLTVEGLLAGVDVISVPLEDCDMVDVTAASVAIDVVAVNVTNVLALMYLVLRYKVL